MESTMLREVWRLADEVFRPKAEETDRGVIEGGVTGNIRLLAEAGCFGQWIETEYGGIAADEATRQEYAMIVASACGVTAFTQQQLLIGSRFVSCADNVALKTEVLPQIASGKLYCGLALSHLRRAGPPMVRAERVAGGYRLNGTAPWVTGWGLIHAFVLGAVVMDPDGGHLFAYIDIDRVGDAVQPGAPMPLIVMNASGTIELTIHDLFVPDDFIMTTCPASDLTREDGRGITSFASLPLGCARGSAFYLRDLAAKRGSDSLSTTAIGLLHEVDALRREALTWNCDCVGHPDYQVNALRTRARALVLAVRAAHTAVVATGGTAHLVTSPPQRFVREAQFYETAVQTSDVQTCTISQLASPLFGR